MQGAPPAEKPRLPLLCEVSTGLRRISGCGYVRTQTHTQTKRCSFMTHAFCSLSHAPRGHYKAQFSHVAMHGYPFCKCKYSMQGLGVQAALQNQRTRRSAPIRSIIVRRPDFNGRFKAELVSVQTKKCMKCLNAGSSCSDRLLFFFCNLSG